MNPYSCELCAESIDPKATGVHAWILGWCPLVKGKPGAPQMAERVGGYAHKTCVEAKTMKSRSDQPALF